MEDTPQGGKPPETPPSGSPPPESPPSGSPPPDSTPPESPPPPETPLPPEAPPQQSANQPIMLVLSYLWLLALIPLLVEKEDPEVQWHAKNGLLLLAGEIALWIALAILSMVPVIGQVLGCGLIPILWIVILVIHIIAIVKALKGERLLIPFISDYVAQWK